MEILIFKFYQMHEEINLLCGFRFQS